MTRPTAAPATWPYTDHRTMAQVMAEEGYHSPYRKISLSDAPANWRKAS